MFFLRSWRYTALAGDEDELYGADKKSVLVNPLRFVNRFVRDLRAECVFIRA